MKNIVIIGAGMGGFVAADSLRSKLGKKARITVIEKSNTQTFSPSLLWVAVGKRNAKKITRKLKLGRGIELLIATVTSIDFTQKVVHAGETSVSYDYLIIAPGATLYPERIPGFAESALNLYSLDGAAQIHSRLQSFRGGKIIVLVSALPFKCPAAPHEAAFLMDAYSKKSGVPTQIQIVTPESLPMPSAGEVIGKNVLGMLAARNIEFLPNQKAVSIDATSKKIKTETGDEFAYDLLVGMPPHGLPAFLSGSPILAENGWVKVKPQTLETSMANVFAVGDVTTIGLKNGKPLPKAGVFAQNEAKVVAEIIAERIQGTEKQTEFKGDGACFLETGFGNAGHAVGNFFAEPGPDVQMKPPSRFAHLSKVMFERLWLWNWY